MTQPTLPSSFTAADAAAALAAAQAALAAQNTLAATVLQLSNAVIGAREAAAAYAKALILALWADVDPYDGYAVQAFTEAAARHVVTAQSTTARTAAAAQAAILQSLGVAVSGVPSNPVDVRSPGVDVTGGRLVLRRPESVDVAYETRPDARVRADDFTTVGMFNRPARTVRAMEAEGASRAVAEAEAQGRIGTLVDGNVMLAQRFAEAEVLQRAVDLDSPPLTVIGYRRVIHPELSRTGVCGLCIAAADQRYKVGTLLDIHLNCKCTIAPITADHDPADDVNAADLGALYKQAGGTSGAELKRVRYQVDEHGELGPTLVPKKKYKPRPAKKRSVPPATSAGGGGGGPPSRGGPPSTAGAADDGDRLTRMFVEQTRGASDEQRAAVRRWQRHDRFYQKVQDAVTGAGDPEALEVARQLIGLASPLPEDTELFRGIRSTVRAFGMHSDTLEDLIGRDWAEGRFMSTTTTFDRATPEFTDPGASPAVIRIVARAGTRAVWVPPLGDPADVDQQELLFPPGAPVRILDIDRSGDIAVIEMEVGGG